MNGTNYVAGEQGRIRLSVAVGTVLEHRAAAVMVIILALALAYWLWFGLTQRIFREDDVLSITAALSILENGLPQRETGHLYHRGYVPNYLVAGSISVFGFNNLAIMLPSLLMGLGTLWLVYLMARDMLGRPWLGVMAAALLVTLGTETFYATSPRMYMALQFLSALAIYCGWRGYVRGEGRFQLPALLAISGAILSHAQGAALVAAISAAVATVLWLGRSHIPPEYSLRRYQNVVGLLVLGWVLWFTFLYSPETASAVIVHAGLDPGWVNIGFDPGRAVGHLWQLNYALPYGLVLIPIPLFLAAGGLRGHRTPQSLSLAYLLVTIALCSLAVFVVIGVPQSRFWFFILPVYALLVAAGITTVVQSLVHKGEDVPVTGYMGLRNVALLLVLGVICSLLLLGVTRLEFTGDFRRLAQQQYGNMLAYSFGQQVRPTAFADLVHSGFRLPCRDPRAHFHNPARCGRQIKEHLGGLRHRIQPEDMVVTSNPFVTPYYLNRDIQGHLVARKTEDDEFVQFDLPQIEGTDILVIDSPEKLETLLKGDKRVWVIADYKLRLYTSEEMQNYISNNYTLFLKDELLTTYVNCLEPPCRSGDVLTDEGIDLPK